MSAISEDGHESKEDAGGLQESFVEIDVNAETRFGGDRHCFVQMMCTQHFAYLTTSKRRAAVDDRKDSDGSSDLDPTIPMAASCGWPERNLGALISGGPMDRTVASYEIALSVSPCLF